MADMLAQGLAALPGVRLVQHVQANELFVALPEAAIAALLAEGALFYRWIEVPGEPLPVIRLVTSFRTNADEVRRFLSLAARYTQADRVAA